MNSMNKKSPGARAIPQPFNRQAVAAPQIKPGVAQLKTAVSAQSVKRPAAPPVYRPQAKPVGVQAKMAGSSQLKNHPVAPPTYKPQPVPKVLQTKMASAQPAQAGGQTPRQPVAPPVYRPAPKKIVQTKMAVASQTFKPPTTPPVYRPQPTPGVLQAKGSRTAATVSGHYDPMKLPGQQSLPHEPIHAVQQRVTNHQVVQRMAMVFSNLRKVSNIPEDEGGGKGAVRGSKIPHHSQTMTIGGGAQQKYNVDDWTNKKSSSTMKGTISQEEVGKDFYKVFDRANRKKLRKMIKAWDCNSTILDAILAEFIFEGEQLAKWYDNSDAGEADTVNLTIKDALSASKALVAHLVASRASIHYRENTMGLLNVSTVEIKYGVLNPVTKDVEPDWDALLHKVREVVRDKLSKGIAPPGTPPSEADSGGAMNTEIFTVIQTVGGFKEMYDQGILYQPNGIGYDFKTQGRNILTGGAGKRGNLITAINHVRFAAWSEWRVVHELLSGQFV